MFIQTNPNEIPFFILLLNEVRLERRIIIKVIKRNIICEDRGAKVKKSIFFLPSYIESNKESANLQRYQSNKWTDAIYFLSLSSFYRIKNTCICHFLFIYVTSLTLEVLLKIYANTHFEYQFLRKRRKKKNRYSVRRVFHSCSGS